MNYGFLFPSIYGYPSDFRDKVGKISKSQTDIDKTLFAQAFLAVIRV